jgi:hypothetical protein
MPTLVSSARAQGPAPPPRLVQRHHQPLVSDAASRARQLALRRDEKQQQEQAPPPPPVIAPRPCRHPATRAFRTASHWTQVERAYHDFFSPTPEQQEQQHRQQQQQQHSSSSPFSWAERSALDAIDVCAASARLAQLCRAKAPDASDRPELFKLSSALHEHLAALAEVVVGAKEEEGGATTTTRLGSSGAAIALWSVAALHRAAPHASWALPAVARRLTRAAAVGMRRMRPGEAAMAAWAVGSLYGGGVGSGSAAATATMPLAAPTPAAASAAARDVRVFFRALERRLGGSPGPGVRLLTAREASTCLWARAAVAPLAAAAAGADASSSSSVAAASTHSFALAMLRCVPPNNEEEDLSAAAPRDLVACLWALAALGGGAEGAASRPAARRWARAAHGALLRRLMLADHADDDTHQPLTAHDVVSLLVAWAPPGRAALERWRQGLEEEVVGQPAAPPSCSSSSSSSCLPRPPPALVAAVARRAVAVLPQAPRALCPAVCAAGRWVVAERRRQQRQRPADVTSTTLITAPLNAAWGEMLLQRAADAAAVRVGAPPSRAAASGRAAQSLARLSGGRRGIDALSSGLERLGCKPAEAEMDFLCAAARAVARDAAMVAGLMAAVGGGGGGGGGG